MKFYKFPTPPGLHFQKTRIQKQGRNKSWFIHEKGPFSFLTNLFEEIENENILYKFTRFGIYTSQAHWQLAGR